MHNRGLSLFKWFCDFPASQPISWPALISPHVPSRYIKLPLSKASDNRFNRWTVREIAAASSRTPPHNVKLAREPGWRRDSNAEKFDFLCHFLASPNSDCDSVMRDKSVSSAQQAITQRLKDSFARWDWFRLFFGLRFSTRIARIIARLCRCSVRLIRARWKSALNRQNTGRINSQ